MLDLNVVVYCIVGTKYTILYNAIALHNNIHRTIIYLNVIIYPANLQSANLSLINMSERASES